MTITARSSTEKILLIKRDRLQWWHGRVHAVDGDGKCLRAHFDLRQPAISNHVFLADLADIVDGHHLPSQPEALFDSGSMSGSRDEGDTCGRQSIAIGGEHRPIVCGLRCGQRRVGVAHYRPTDHAVLDNNLWFGAEKCWLPQYEVRNLADLDGAEHVG